MSLEEGKHAASPDSGEHSSVDVEGTDAGRVNSVRATSQQLSAQGTMKADSRMLGGHVVNQSRDSQMACQRGYRDDVPAIPLDHLWQKGLGRLHSECDTSKRERESEYEWYFDAL